MPAIKYLRFYLDRKCVVVPGWGKTKKTRKDCGSWSWWHTERNTDMLKGNAKVRNGTGGLLIVDVDPKNGGSVASLKRRFPDLPDTRTVRTVTQHPDGPGVHLIFTMPSGVRLATNRPLGPGIDVPDAVMLPGSIYRGDDGVDRKYTLVNEVEPAPAPLALVAAVDKGQASTDGPPLDVGSAAGVLDRLLRRWAEAGPGERNFVFTEVGIPILRLAGERGPDLLRYAYAGDDAWLDQAIESASRKAGITSAPMFRLRSRYVDEFLHFATLRARYGRWSNASARRVTYAVVSRCSSTVQATTPFLSLRDLALMSGIETRTVANALSRSLKSGDVYVVATDEDGLRQYTPVVGEMTTVSSKGITPLRGLLVDPCHDVWMCTGLTGRASQVFDLVDVGFRKASQIAAAGGMGRDTARDALRTLVDVGMLEKDSAVYTVPDNVAEMAERLAEDLGGRARRAKLTDRISEERARPRGDAEPVSDTEVFERDDDYERRRRKEDGELMRQVGML